MQLNLDATRMSQAFAGNGYAQQIVLGEVNEFVQRHRGTDTPPGRSGVARPLQPDLSKAWFGPGRWSWSTSSRCCPSS